MLAVAWYVSGMTVQWFMEKMRITKCLSFIIRSIVEKLGDDRMSKTKVIGDEEVKQSFYGQLVFGKGVSSSMDEQLAKEVAKAGRTGI